MVQAAARTPYRVKVHWLETCNCEAGCNCNFGGFPDHGNCEALIGIQVAEGSYGDVDLTGVKAVVAVWWPKAIHEGQGKAVLFMDEGARPEQMEGLGGILSGQAGGMPWEILSTTLDSVEGPVVRPIEMTIDGRRSSFRIPGVFEAQLAPLKNPVTGEENEVHVVFPKGGLIWDDGDAATTERMHFQYGDKEFDYSGQNAFYSLAEWTNQK